MPLNLLTSELIIGLGKKPENEVVVNSLADFPTPIDTGDGNGVAIHLATNCTYTLGADITTSYTVVSPDNYGFAILRSLGVQTYTYTGSGVAFTDSNKKFGSFTLSYLFSTAPTGTWFDFESDVLRSPAR